LGGHPVVVEMEMSTQPRGAKPGEVLAAIGDFTDVRARRTHQWIERDGARQETHDDVPPATAMDTAATISPAISADAPSTPEVGSSEIATSATPGTPGTPG